MTHIPNSLIINDLKLRLHLGWPRNERLKVQTVLLNISIYFAQPLKACETDKLEDTFCYSVLINHIHEKISGRHFHLIEHLCAEIYKLLKNLLPNDAKLTVSVTKKPKIVGLVGNVCFTFGDPI